MTKISISVESTRLLSNDEAAAFLRLSPRTLEKHRYHGTGPRFFKAGRRVLYTDADLESWVTHGARTETHGR